MNANNFKSDSNYDHNNFEYWQSRFYPIPAPVEIPFRRKIYLPDKGQRLKSLSYRFGRSLSKKLITFCQQSDVHPAIGLIALIESVLFRYTGQEDIVIGALIPQVENTYRDQTDNKVYKTYDLALRNLTSADTPFDTLLRQLQKNVMADLNHLDLNYGNLMKDLLGQADTSLMELCALFFEYHEEQAPEIYESPKNSGAAAEIIQWNLDLKLSFYCKDDELSLILTYNEQLYKEVYLKNFMGHLRTLISNAIINPKETIGQFMILTHEEMVKLDKWSGYQEDYSFERCIHQIFEEQAQKTPDKVAVIYQGLEEQQVSLTYSELNRRADCIAKALQKKGVGPESAVGVFLKRSLETVACLLGILKAGGIYVPLDLSYPSEYIDFILNDTQLTVLITQENLTEKLPQQTYEVLFIENLIAEGLDSQECSLEQRADITYPAVIMYTSGSTGTPKGVKHRQHQLINRFNWLWKNYPFTEADVFLQRTTVNFMPSMWELLGGLLRGIPTVMLSDEVVKDPGKFVQALNKHKVTYMAIVPSLLRMIFETNINLGEVLGKVRLCISAGEPLTIELYRKFRTLLPQVILLNDHGATEVNGVLYFDSRWDNGDSTRLPRTKPIANIRVYLLDKNMQRVPVGIPGEIFIGGISVAMGYVNNPKLNDEKFIINPFHDDSGPVLYRMGDMARFHNDGTIESIGRMDNQVKINGKRVELDSIEHVINQHPDVQEVVIAVHERRSGGKNLVAFVALKTGKDNSGEELKEFIRSKLPEYMTPTQFIALEEIPRTPNGKIDRKAFRNVTEAKEKYGKKSDFGQKAEFYETSFIQKAAELLEIDLREINSAKKFYELGFDSASIVEYVKVINEEFGANVTVTDIYDHSSIKELVKFIKTRNTDQPNFNQNVNEVMVSKIDEAKEEEKIPAREDSLKEGQEKVAGANDFGGGIKHDNTFRPVDVENTLATKAAEILEVSPSEILAQKKFYELGFDSVSIVEYLNQLNTKFNTKLEVTDFYDHSTIKDLSSYIASKYTSQISNASNTYPESAAQKALSEKGFLPESNDKNHPIDTESSRVNTSSLGDDLGSNQFELGLGSDVAIIGMSCRYPGAQNLLEFWDMLQSGKNAITEVPPQRWKHEDYYDPDAQKPYKTNSKWGGFIDGVQEFDPSFFNISRVEAEFMDPQQRLCLEECWRALEDAGYSESAVSESKVGVFIGSRPGDYDDLINEMGVDPGAYTLMGNDMAILAARISYYLNLKGPCMTIDTACSSSMVAIHLACKSIQAGESEMALAGGVCILSSPSLFITSSKFGMLSPTGQCKTFDQSADGFVPGEGVGIVVLKSLAKALRDGDHVYGVVKGSGVNQDGRTNGITAPSVISQTTLEKQVYREYRINPETISYVEAHGTGTKLGDPIEIKALTDAFREWTQLKNFCAIGSVKTNIGHTVAAAGVAGLIKVLLAMENQQIPPMLNLQNLNEFINFSESPFYPNTQLTTWEPNNIAPRRAALSSFGFSGTNCHMVIEESPLKKSTRFNELPFYIIPVSSKSEMTSDPRIRDLYLWLEQKESRLRIGDIAYTLWSGQELLPHRLVMVVKDIEELKNTLKEILENGQPDNCCQGIVTQEKVVPEDGCNPGEELIQELVGGQGRLEDYKEKLNQIAPYYIEGHDFNLRGYYRQNGYSHVIIPPYSFAREKFWIKKELDSQGLQTHSTLFKLHPLIHQNISTIYEEKFQTRFTGREFFITDHVIDGRKLLPGVISLEMARVAGELATKQKVLSIKECLWVKPVDLSENEGILNINLRPVDENLNFEIFSIHPGKEDIIHSSGFLELRDEPSPEEYLEIEKVKERCPQIIHREDCYQMLGSMGLNYGPNFQVIQTMYRGNNEVLSYIELPEKLRDGFSDFMLHPALTDGALQTVIGLYNLAQNTGEVYFPYEIKEIEVRSHLPQQCYIHALPAKPNEATPGFKTFNVLILEMQGRVIVKINEFVQKSARNELQKVPVLSPTGEFPTYFSRSSWRLMESPLDETDQVEHGDTLIFDLDDEFYRAFTGNQTKQSKGRTILILPGTGYKKTGDLYEINPLQYPDYQQLMLDLKNQGIKPQKVMFLWSYERSQGSEELEKYLTHGIYAAFHLTNALIRQNFDKEILLLYLVHGNSLWAEASYNSLSGFCKSVRRERPGMDYKILQFHPENGEQPVLDFEKLVLRVRREMRDGSRGTELRFVGEKRYIRYFEEVETVKDNTEPATVLRENGVYLITGGAGSLGLIFAEYLANKVKAKLVLTGRSDLGDQQLRKIQQLEELGAEIVYIKSDLAQKTAVESLIHSIKERFGGINGIIHSAGVVRDAFLHQKTVEQMEEVIAPKVFGTHYLDWFTKDEPLDFIVLFSSIAAISGNLGQSDYAYANSFLDNYAEIRQRLTLEGQRKGRALSINWPLWLEGGMGANRSTRDFLEEYFGLQALETKTGIDAFLQLLQSDVAQAVVFRGSQAAFRSVVGMTAEGTSPLPPESPAEETEATLLQKIRQSILEDITVVLKTGSNKINFDTYLGEYGLDSVSMLEFSTQLNKKYQTKVTPAIFFEYGTLNLFTKHLAEKYSDLFTDYYRSMAVEQSSRADGDISAGTIQRKDLSAESRLRPQIKDDNQHRFGEANEPVAIIGISGIMPQSENVDIFWSNLIAEKELISEIPLDRWDWKDFFGDPAENPFRTNVKWGGFMKRVDEFDADFFNISPLETELMDPQQRLLLETVWKAIEDAGYKASDLSGTKTGVFIGAFTNDYAQLLAESGVSVEAHAASGNDHSILANRISYFFNVQGPSEAIDTACSSSLVAVHRAIQSIQRGESTAAIVGGVNVLLSPLGFIRASKAGMLSNDGKIRSFDKNANGYLRGEGIGVVLLKPLRKAIKDRDHIYAVIKGSAVNHGGKGYSLLAPNPVAQAEVIVSAYENAGVSPDTVNYIEAHGTGTVIGDPIEINAYKKAFEKLTPITKGNNQYCGVGTIKPNTGHLEAASGMASLLKLIMAFKYQRIPATIHCQELNPQLELEESPFYIVNKTQEWTQLTDSEGNLLPRRAGLHSYGFGGTNAHLILEEYTPNQYSTLTETGKPVLLVFSAKNQERLKEYLQGMLVFVRNEPNIDLQGLAYTLQIGREEMETRLAVITTGMADFITKAESYLNGVNDGPGIFEGIIQLDSADIQSIPAGKQDKVEALKLDSYPTHEELSKIAVSWTGGTKINWSRYWLGAERRISIPTYPFAKNSYWIPFENRQVWRAKLLGVSPVSQREAKQVGMALNPYQQFRKTPPSSPEIFADYLKAKIALLLGSEKERISSNKVLHNYGFDSIMSAKLKYQLENEFSARISMSDIGLTNSIDELARSLFQKLNLAAAAGDTSQAPLSDRFPVGEPIPGLLVEFLNGENELDDITGKELDHLYDTFTEYLNSQGRKDSLIVK